MAIFNSYVKLPEGTTATIKQANSSPFARSQQAGPLWHNMSRCSHHQAPSPVAGSNWRVFSWPPRVCRRCQSADPSANSPLPHWGAAGQKNAAGNQLDEIIHKQSSLPSSFGDLQDAFSVFFLTVFPYVSIVSCVFSIVFPLFFPLVPPCFHRFSMGFSQQKSPPPEAPHPLQPHKRWLRPCRSCGSHSSWERASFRSNAAV